MKKLIKISFALLFVSLIGLSSCEEANNDPDIDPREQYVGTWSCNESGINYSVVIGLDQGNSSQILINNFHYFGANEKAYAIATQNNLTLPTQIILNNTIYGSGTLVSSERINLKYYVNDQTDIDTINAVYTK